MEELGEKMIGKKKILREATEIERWHIGGMELRGPWQRRRKKRELESGTGMSTKFLYKYYIIII